MFSECSLIAAQYVLMKLLQRLLLQEGKDTIILVNISLMVLINFPHKWIFMQGCSQELHNLLCIDKARGFYK